MTAPVHVRGLGLWAPEFPSVTAWREGRPLPTPADRPAAKLIGGRLKRGSSRFAQMLAEVTEQAAEAAGFDVGRTPTVYGSSLGEIETMVTLLRMLFEEEGKLSPNRFKNSVHNAASGLISIGTQNTTFSTAIAGGARSFEVAFLEAWAFLQQRGGDLILAVSDDRPPEPLRRREDHGGLAVAVALSTTPPSTGPVHRLAGLRPEGEAVAPRTARVPAAWEGNPATEALALFEAVLADRPGVVPLGPPGAVALAVDLEVERR
jgi:hypothetical protein